LRERIPFPTGVVNGPSLFGAKFDVPRHTKPVVTEYVPKDKLKDFVLPDDLRGLGNADRIVEHMQHHLSVLKAEGLGAEVVIVERSIPRMRELDNMFQGRILTRYSTQDAVEEEILKADVVIGAGRTLQLVRALLPTSTELKDMDGALTRVPGWIAAAREAGQRVVTLATGDPLCHGIGAWLIEKLGSEAVEILPAPSTLQLAFARFKRPWTDVTIASCHNADAGEWFVGATPDHGLYPVMRSLALHARVAVFTGPANNPARLARAVEAVHVPVAADLTQGDLIEARHSYLAAVGVSGQHQRDAVLPELVGFFGDVGERQRRKIAAQAGHSPFDPGVSGVRVVEPHDLQALPSDCDDGAVVAQDLDAARFIDPGIAKNYPKGDLHRMYVGAIEGAWERGAP